MLDRPLERRAAEIETPEVPALEARGLCYEAGGRRLIDGADLVAPRGALTAALGANGAGKSLLLRLLHGLIAPSAGEVLCDGAPICAAARTEQAMVAQRPALLRRSVLDNMVFAYRARGTTVDRPRLNALLEAVGLLDKAKRPARRLSGGEQQRLALARALATGPRTLFLDEPTANVDPDSTLAIEALTRAAREDGATILLATHDLGQARRLADRVLFLDRGRVVEQGPAARFFAGPQTARAQAYLAGRLC